MNAARPASDGASTASSRRQPSCPGASAAESRARAETARRAR